MRSLVFKNSGPREVLLVTTRRGVLYQILPDALPERYFVMEYPADFFSPGSHASPVACAALSEQQVLDLVFHED